MWKTLKFSDGRFVGGTLLLPPPEHGGAQPSLLDRRLGIQNLVNAFEAPRTTEMVFHAETRTFTPKPVSPPCVYGWPMALLEMLLDPILVRWVPGHIVEQYARWNPCLKDALAEVSPPPVLEQDPFARGESEAAQGAANRGPSEPPTATAAL